MSGTEQRTDEKELPTPRVTAHMKSAQSHGPRWDTDGLWALAYQLERELAEAKRDHAADASIARALNRIDAAFPSATRASDMPKPLNEMTVPLLDAISEPCKGCGKRPVDFVSGSVTDRTAGKS